MSSIAVRLLVVSLSLLCSIGVVACPDLHLDLSDEVGHCDYCGEHGTERWSLNVRLENRSSMPIYVLGIDFPKDDGTKNFEFPYFFYESKDGSHEWKYLKDYYEESVPSDWMTRDMG